MGIMPWYFAAENLLVDDIYRRNHRMKKFYCPTYIGKLEIGKPESLRPGQFNMYEGCGSFCYVFGVSIWHTLFSGHLEFRDEPKEKFRNIDCTNEFILVGENGTFLFTRDIFNCNKFYRCMQPQDCLFQFIDYNSEGRSWNFEYIEEWKYSVVDEYLSYSNLFKCPSSVLDPCFPCPEEIWDKFSFLSRYRKKMTLGPEIPIPEKTKEIFQVFTRNSIVSAKKIETFHVLRYLGNRYLKIFEVDATLFVLNNEPDPNQYSAIYIKDFPKFDADDDNEMKRRPEMWLYDPKLRGYCCGSYDDFYRIAFEKNLKQLEGIVIDIRKQNIHICITNLNLEMVLNIPLEETEFAKQIMDAYVASKVIKVEVLSFFNAIETKYKITKCHIS